jgi:Carboxypeptidase regulatory-like domain/TonB dependent receptor-like, beta-barrel
MHPQRAMGRFVGAVLLGAALVASGLSAQTTGSIEGRILAPDGSALAGAGIAATGAVPGGRSAKSDAAGRYHLAALPPGAYELEATLAGFGPQKRAVIVSLGATTTVDFSLTPAIAEQTTVVGESPLVDTHAVEVGNTVDAQAFARLPLARDYTAIAVFQPGVTEDGAGFSVFGATGLENAYFIDGVNVTGMRTGAQTKVVPEEFLEEVQLHTATFPAEYGGAAGGIVNAITRSGGNEYHGEMFGYFDNQSLQATAKPGVVGGNFAGFRDQDIGLGLGGYLLKDRLWFFGVYDRTGLVRDVRLVTGSGSPYDGSTFRSQDRNSNLYAAKLTWAPSSSVQVIGSVIGDPATDAQQLVQDGPPQSRQIHETTGAPDASLIATRTADWWLAQVGLFDHRERQDRTPDFVPPFLTTDDTQVPTLDLANCNLPGCYTGAPWVFIPTSPALLREKYESKQEHGSFTGFLGRHEFKAGFQLAQNDGQVYQSIPGGYDRALNRLADGTVLYTQSWFGDPSGQFGSSHVVPVVSGAPKTDTMAFYVQDSWTPVATLTLDVGVRYNAYTLKDAVTGGTITTLKNNFAPRIGVSWDPTGRGREKVTLAYGRFFQPIPMDHQSAAFVGSSLSVTSPFGFSFDCGPTAVACQSFPNRFAEPADPRLKAPATDELSAGYETKLTENLKVGVHGVYSRLVRAVEDRCDLQGNDAAYAFTGNGCVLMNPGEGDYGRGVFPSVMLPGGVSEPILCTNGFNPEEGRASVPCQALPEAKRTYEGIMLTVEQRFSGDTYLLASYVYSRLRGNYDGSFNELGQANPNTNLDFDYPGLLANAYGKLANDRPHQFKVTGYHRLPFGLTVGVNAYYRSGTPEDKLGSFALINGAPIPLYLAPRGSQGRTPADWDADLHLDYTLPVRAVHVAVIADIFRVFNRQTVLRTNPFYNFDGFQSDNVVQTNPDYGAPILRADPRLARVGLRVWF